MNIESKFEELENITKDNNFVCEKITDLKNEVLTLLNTSDNSDYAVPPTASPKLPSFYDVIEAMRPCGYGLEILDFAKKYHSTLKKLGNFA